MPILSANPAPTIDVNANSNDRHRRNWQAIMKGAVQSIIKLATGSGLTNGTAGLAINVDGTTTTINGSNQIVALSSGGGGGTLAFIGSPVFSIGGSPVSLPGTLTLGFVNGGTSDFLAVNATGTASLRGINSADLTNGLIPTWGGESITFTNTSTVSLVTALSIAPTYNNPNHNVDIYINRTETHVPAASQYFIQGNVGGTSQFYVNHTGVANFKQYLINSFAFVGTGGQFYVPSGGLVIDSSGNFYSTQSGLISLDNNGQLFAQGTGSIVVDVSGHIYGPSGATPSITAGTGAGASPTISIAGNDDGGVISLTLGTTPSGAGATIATVTYANPWNVVPSSIVLTPANAAAAALTSTQTPFIDISSATASIFKILANTVALSGGPFKWWYQLSG